MTIEGWPILLDIYLPPPYHALRQEGALVRTRPARQPSGRPGTGTARAVAGGTPLAGQACRGLTAAVPGGVAVASPADRGR